MTTANGLLWEPDGATLHVRFCKGSARRQRRVLLLTKPGKRHGITLSHILLGTRIDSRHESLAE
jgi:hypothetical protein